MVSGCVTIGLDEDNCYFCVCEAIVIASDISLDITVNSDCWTIKKCLSCM